MRILARNAEALFWLARYLERAASLARVIEMQSSFGGRDRERGWSWLLALHADEERFREANEISSASIVAFYVTESSNPGSIRSSIHWARENARALRPFIPLEMWVQLNAFHASAEAIGSADVDTARLPRTCSQIRAGCHAQIGIAESTLFRDEGYLFFRLGLLFERADQTSRLLDVKFAQASVAAGAADPADEFVFWSTILRTAAAYQVYHRLHAGSTEAESVVRFLILNPSHPRSIGFCVREIGEALQILRGSFHLTRANRCQETCEVMMQGLQAAGRDQDLPSKLHQFNDWVQASLISLTADLDTSFFKPAPPANSGRSKPGVVGGQSQQQS